MPWKTVLIFGTLVFNVFSFDLNLKHSEDFQDRQRRDISDSGTVPAVCSKALNKKAKDKIERHLYPLSGDNNSDVTLVWLGDKKETQILLTTIPQNSLMQMFASLTGGIKKSPSNIYRSTDGGQTFVNIEDKIGKEAIRSSNGIMKSPVDANRLVLISYVSANIFETIFRNKNKHESLIVTTDGGETFTVNPLPFRLRENESIRFHPTRKDWLIALEAVSIVLQGMTKMTKTGCGYISKDFGKTWSSLLKGEVVEDIRWGALKGHEDDIFAQVKNIGTGSFFMHGFSAMEKSALFKSTDQIKFNKIVESCSSFGVQNEYVFATVSVKVGGVQKRLIHVSHDNGVSFHKIHSPPLTSDMFFAILEIHKGLIFLHVDDPGDTGKGVLYVSGPEGRVYEESLKNHFYTNAGFTDFYNVESMPGVYITQVLVDTDKSLKSVITYDRGIKWQPLNIDRKKYCKDEKYVKDPKLPCSLHFHHQFSRQQRHTIASYVQSPISSPKAPGLILLHGQAGDALTGRMDVWMSKDGGYQWTEIAKGPHHYAIGDNGNLIVLVPKINSTGRTLKYSIDQGRCWHEFEFADKNQPLVIRGLVAEPHSEERSFSLWGYQKNIAEKERVWKVITIDFNNMFEKKCDASSFETWYPHKANGKDGCFLGEKLTFRRPKEDEVCYIGRDFNSTVKTEKCKCTTDDVVCDYGYERNKANKCVRNKEKFKLMFCKDGEEETSTASKGYRRVPGDVCNSKEAAETYVTDIDAEKKCTKNEEENEKEVEVGMVKVERARIEKMRKDEEHKQKLNAEFQEAQSKAKSKKKKKNSAWIGIVIGLVLVCGLVIAGVWYTRRFIRSRKSKPSYVRSTLSGFPDEDDDTNGGDSNEYRQTGRPKRNNYRDESDIDDEPLSRRTTNT